MVLYVMVIIRNNYNSGENISKILMFTFFGNERWVSKIQSLGSMNFFECDIFKKMLRALTVLITKFQK